jgi:hypothetical protein
MDRIEIKVTGYFGNQDSLKVPDDVMKDYENKMIDMLLEHWDSFNWKSYMATQKVTIEKIVDINIFRSKSPGVYVLKLLFKALGSDTFISLGSNSSKNMARIQKAVEDFTKIKLSKKIMFHVTSIKSKLSERKKVEHHSLDGKHSLKVEEHVHKTRTKKVMHKGKEYDPEDLIESKLSKAFVSDSDSE